MQKKTSTWNFLDFILRFGRNVVHILIERPLHILAVIAIIIKRLLQWPWFYFSAIQSIHRRGQSCTNWWVLIYFGNVSLGLLTLEAQNLILAGAQLRLTLLFSRQLNLYNAGTLSFSTTSWAQWWPTRNDEVDQAYLRDQVVIVGYGDDVLLKIWLIRILKSWLQSWNCRKATSSKYCCRKWTEPGVLIQAHIMHARLLVLWIF